MSLCQMDPSSSDVLEEERTDHPLSDTVGEKSALYEPDISPEVLKQPSNKSLETMEVPEPELWTSPLPFQEVLEIKMGPVVSLK